MDLADVYAARQAIRDVALRSPLITAHGIGEPGSILLKLETLQPTGAFKIRGAANAVAALSAKQREAGVICCSTGNHGRAVAYVAAKHGIASTICISNLVPENKVKAISDLGARVVRDGRSQDDAQGNVDAIVTETGATEIPPFDYEGVIAGQATIALELLEERPDIGEIVIPVSGGGLAGGIAFAAKTINPSIRVVGVSMERGAAMHESLAQGRPVEVVEQPTLADSLGGGIGTANRYTFDLCRGYIDQMVLVSEAELYAAMRTLFLREKIVAEGAGAAAYAALLSGRIRSSRTTAVIVSGGNVVMEVFARIVRGEPVAVGELMVAA
ncbi:MAG TPA: pyridoxal-phosphate dependent enzyme [Aestuariivirgaceae bacterium]|nr:pyridoxal-phosphate dependent enzyme [Aestuariivirgaceae bacterium]